jgi:hypothetical protein
MKLYEFIQACPSRVYTSMSCLIFEHIIVFTNDLFIIKTETESSLIEPNQIEFISSLARLTPLGVSIVRLSHGWRWMA